jgi:hypothetical protein
MRVLFAILLVIGCTDDDETNAPPAVCSTQSAWLLGDEESPLMHPGGACIDCHSAEEGPRFTVAGTVMASFMDDTNCNGVAGVTIRVTGSDNQLVELTSNRAGNFFLENRAIARPFTVELVHEGRSRRMMTPQTDGDCNGCHTAQGDAAIPGRILVP